MINPDRPAGIQTPIGPNVRRLIAERAAAITVNRATKNRAGSDMFCAVLAQIATPGALKQDYYDACVWVKAALAAARRAPGAEQWPTDEDMAGEVLRRLKKVKGQAKR